MPTAKSEKKAAERLGLIQWMGTGEAFRIYPYKTLDGHMEWLSLTARKPSGMTLEQWEFMQKTVPEMKELLLLGKNVKANEKVTELMEGQRLYGGNSLPTPTRVKAEILYNKTVKPLWSGVACLLIGFLVMAYSFFRKPTSAFRTGVIIGVWIAFLYIVYAMGMIWYVGDHIPVSNGPETMMFMALIAAAGAAFWGDTTIRGALMTVGVLRCA